MTTIVIPSILTANTFFYSPSKSASGRRSNENRNQVQVATFFTELGFQVSRNGDTVTAISDTHKLEVSFSYNETCGNVYKTLSISRNGKRSNISAIKKLVA